MRRFAAALLVALTLAPAASAFAWSPGECDAPRDLLRLDTQLTRTRARLVPGGTLTIVAIGSSSTAGAGASSPGMAYPSRLKKFLAAEYPATKVRVLNRGVNGEVTTDMLARFDRDVIAHKPDLVIWQVGANSVLRSAYLETYADDLRVGINRLKAAGADIILMDPQYAPKVLAKPMAPAVLVATDMVAHETGAGLFRRFDIMRHWVQGGVLTFPVILDPDQLHLNDRGYGCVASVLAVAIAETARPLTD